MKILASYSNAELFALEDKYYDDGDYAMYAVVHRELMRRKDA